MLDTKLNEWIIFWQADELSRQKEAPIVIHQEVNGPQEPEQPADPTEMLPVQVPSTPQNVSSHQVVNGIISNMIDVVVTGQNFYNLILFYNLFLHLILQFIYFTILYSFTIIIYPIYIIHCEKSLLF